nr:pyridoxal-phosphate dependent enzyme [Thermosynechococcus vestitus]
MAKHKVRGARSKTIEGNFDKALEIVRLMAETYPVTLVNSVNPYRLEGQKTAAFEVVDSLGNAGNITAYWMGFCQYREQNRCDRLPRMMGFQAAGSAPLVKGEIVTHPETIATAIRIGNPANWQRAIAVKEASQGAFNAVTDEEILKAYCLLAIEPTEQTVAKVMGF